MNLATMTAAPTTLVVGGRSFLIGPLRYLELGMIQRHLDETCPSPLRLAEAEGLEGEALDEARKASRGWRPPVVGEDQRWVDALFGSTDGVIFFLNLLFSARNPGFSADDLAHVLAHVGPKQLRPLFLVAMEEPADPEPARGGDAPKAGAAPSTTRGSTGCSSRARAGRPTGSTG